MDCSRESPPQSDGITVCPLSQSEFCNKIGTTVTSHVPLGIPLAAPKRSVAEAPRGAGLVRHQTSGGGSKFGISQLHARVIRSYAQIMSNAHVRRQLLSDHGPGGLHGSRPRPGSQQRLDDLGEYSA